MELRKESVQMLHVKSRATSQVTFDADYNVPDAKPDMGRLIQSKGDIVMDEVRLSEGKAFISGNLNVDILYVGEEIQKVSRLWAILPFDESLNLPNGGPGKSTMTMSHYIYNTSFVQSPNFGYAAAMSIVILVMVAVLALIQMIVGDER